MPDETKTHFKLGRGHESDVRVSDISVSRCHALVKFNNSTGRFYLEDNLSKFGTLVLAKSNIPLEPDLTKAVQIGRSVISFTVKPYNPPTVTASQMKAVTAKKEVKEPTPQKTDRFTNMEIMLQSRIEETNLKISQLMQSALTVPNQNDLSEMIASVDDDSEAKANYDHLMRATNHLKLA